MDIEERITKVNRAVQGYMHTHGARMLKADEAAELVYAAGIMSPDEGPPDARGFVFRQFLRDLRSRYGYEILFSLMGVRQAHNQPGGAYTFFKFNLPPSEKIRELLATPLIEGDASSGSTQRTESLPDHLQPGLDVVFVGTSVGGESATRPHHYSDPHDKFWDLVNQAGLVSDFVGAENDHLILDEKCGLTDLAKKQVSNSDACLKTTDFDVDGFVKKIERVKPKVVAFNGRQAYKGVFMKDPKDYGFADDIIGDSYVFVLPASSGAETSMTYPQKLHWYKKLKGTLRTL